MSAFFHPPGDPRLLLYSERGLMSHLFVSQLPASIDLILDAATNLDGRRLRDAVGDPARYRLLTEFDLGKVGFGWCRCGQPVEGARGPRRPFGRGDRDGWIDTLPVGPASPAQPATL